MRLADSLRPFSSQEWGPNTERLLRGLVSVGPFFILARAATAGGQILAGRWLGPTEFGLATLVGSTSGILLLPLSLGFPASAVKFTAMETTVERRTAVLSTFFWLQLAWGAVCGAALYLLREPLGRALHIAPAIYLWCLFYTGLLALYSFFSNALQGAHLFGARGKIEFLYGAATLLLFLGGYRLALRTFGVFIGAMDAALVLASLACLYSLRIYLRPVMTREAVRAVASYTPPSVLGGCAGAALEGAAPLILAAYLSPREVGYFGAYMMGSLTVAMLIFQTINAVLSPLASAPARHAGVWRKFFVLSIPFSIASFLLLCASQAVMLKLIGKGYPIVPSWICLFSAASVFSLLYFCALAMLSARDAQGAWLGTGGALVTGVGCLAGNLWAIPRFGFAGSALALLIGFGGGFLWCAFWGTYRLTKRETA